MDAPDNSEWRKMYKQFAGKEGMSLEEFGNGYRAQEEGEVSEEMIGGAFWMGDLNQDGNLSWKEFERLM